MVLLGSRRATDLDVCCDIRLGNVRLLVIRGSLEYWAALNWEVREVDTENFEFLLDPIQR
jgi:hypothetical protein